MGTTADPAKKTNLQIFEEGDKTLAYLFEASNKNMRNWEAQYEKEKSEIQDLYDKFQIRWNSRLELLANVFEPEAN